MLTNTNFRENGGVVSDKYKDDFGNIDIYPEGQGEYIKRRFIRGAHMSWNRVLTIQPILTTQKGKLIYIAIDGAHLIKSCYETFIMYDADDNIIMTIDDLNENSFVEYKYKYGLALTVTQEMVEAGRKKYAGTTEDKKNIFVPGEIGVEIVPVQDMIRITNPDAGQFTPRYIFTDKDKNYQMQYLVFRQTEKDVKNIRLLYIDFVASIASEMFKLNFVGFSPFRDSAVKNEYNGDYGNAVPIPDPNSDFFDFYPEFKYAEVKSYYKLDRGIVIQLFLYNDRNIFYDPQLMEIVHSFAGFTE
jgi:hypothetical protein